MEPRLGEYKSDDNDLLTDEDVALMNVTDLERKGLINAGIATIVYFVIIASLVVPQGGILRDPKLGTIVPSPLLSSMIAILFFWFVLVALVYGITAKTIRSSDDVIKYMSESMKGFAGFIVLCFFAAQFVECFSYTNLGLFLAVEGADYLQSSRFIGIPLIIAFVILVSLINFYYEIGRASCRERV